LDVRYNQSNTKEFLNMDMQISFPGNKRVDADYKGFTIRTDQCREEGGDGTAPEPFDLFLASIGTCAGIYVLSFCRERGLSTDGLGLNLSFERNEKTWMVEKIRMEITVPPEIPLKYRKALARAAGLCTVKKHFAAPPAFDIVTSEGAPNAASGDTPSPNDRRFAAA
jgi:ribosomal protein S12 methylthiotransferase accessory factor